MCGLSVASAIVSGVALCGMVSWCVGVCAGDDSRASGMLGDVVVGSVSR